MMTEDLTEKQAKFFRFILGYAREHGVFPSYQTIIDETWITSKNSVHQYYQALRAKNYIEPGGRGVYKLHPSKRFLIDAPEHPIPIKGIISAGGMQQAVESDLGSLSIRDLFPRAKSPYCLRVSGDSMEESGIYDGDLVILDDQELKNGDIGALLYDGDTTLKEVHFGHKIVLYPKNQNYEPIEIAPDTFEEVSVLGRYVAHIHDGRVQYIR
jgi:SOS-response transcriptional repressor LexA